MTCFGIWPVIVMILCATSLGKTQPGHTPASQNQSESITIEILPTDDFVYKIPDDLHFENWNIGISVKGLDSVSGIDRLRIKHFSEQNQVNFVEYSGNALSEFLMKQEDGEIIFHNLHFMLPENLKTDRLTVEILSKESMIGQKAVNLLRYKQHNHYRLPVEGTWFVSSGYDFGVEHRRHLSRGQFAWDFIRVDRKGHGSSGPRLKDNFSFGQPVLAPAPGIVIDLENGAADNEPGSVDRNGRANFVEIDHGNGEISRAMHLEKGSIPLKIGDSVVAGQVIGRVGNSGWSDSPHLHFGFQSTVSDGEGGQKQIPIPVMFTGYRVTWNQGTDILMETGRPRRGQFIRQE